MWEARGVGKYSKTYPDMLGLKSISLPLIILVSETPIMLNSKFNSSKRWTWFSRFRLMHQPTGSCAQPPAPNPGLMRGICPPCQSRGWGICKFWAARGTAICQPQGFDTQTIILEKQDDWLICQGREKIEEDCKGMFSILCIHFFIAYQANYTYIAWRT